MRGAGGKSGIDGAPGCRPFRSGRLCITGLVEYAYGNEAATLPEHVPTSAPELFEHGLDASVERGVEELRALAHAVLRFGIIAPSARYRPSAPSVFRFGTARPYLSFNVLPPSSRLRGETKVPAPVLSRNTGVSESRYRVGGRMAPSMAALRKTITHPQP